MELNFIKDNNKYVSEFEVSSDFNLHIERNEGGTLYIQQRTGNGQYDTVKDAVFKLGDSVIDYDFQALVYPKYIKIISDINPIAYITSDGEVTEIKSQTKEVEVTANGTTQVAPDAGYSYLTGVTVKTNVPQSGGSGGTEASSMEYLDTSGMETAAKVQLFMTAAVLVKYNGVIAPLAPLILEVGESVLGEINYIATDFNIEVVMQGNRLKLKDIIPNTDSIPRITEEEFYTI